MLLLTSLNATKPIYRQYTCSYQIHSVPQNQSTGNIHAPTNITQCHKANLQAIYMLLPNSLSATKPIYRQYTCSYQIHSVPQNQSTGNVHPVEFGYCRTAMLQSTWNAVKRSSVVTSLCNLRNDRHEFLPHYTSFGITLCHLLKYYLSFFVLQFKNN